MGKSDQSVYVSEWSDFPIFVWQVRDVVMKQEAIPHIQVYLPIYCLQ